MKRVLAFLLLLALGALALHFAVGDDAVVTAGGSKPAAGEATPKNDQGMGVDAGQGGATWIVRGALHFPKFRAVPLPDGGERNDKVFDLEAKDSQPVSAGLQQLDQVTVTLFDRGAPAAVVTSRQAFVELGRDLSGKASLKEDKEIDLRDAVFTTLPGSRLAGLRLELGHAKVLVRDDVVQIQTASETGPVHLQLDGERAGSLRGAGLVARLPRDPKGLVQRADIDILHDPVLETEGLTMRARGRLRYTEDTGTGAGQWTVEDDVQLALEGGLSLPRPGAQSGTRSVGKAVARGDQLTVWMQRGKQLGADGKRSERLRWRLAQLHGGPATIEATGLRLSTPSLTLIPGLSGEPFVATAAGGTSRVEEVLDAAQLAAGKVPMTGTSPRRIHLLRPGDQAAAIHGAFGFPQWTLRQLREQQVVAFEGSSELRGDQNLLRASRGLQVFGSDPDLQAGAVHGFGDIRIEQHPLRKGDEELLAIGDDGFRMHRTTALETIELGPARPAEHDAAASRWQQHRYELHRGGAVLRGRGSCRLERRGTLTSVALRAPGAEIEGRLATGGADLTGVRSLRAELQGEQVTSLFVTGLPAVATLAHEGSVLTAAAPVLQQLDRNAFCLLPPQTTDDESLWAGLPDERRLPTLRRSTPASSSQGAAELATTAPRIEVHHLGGRHAIVTALATPEHAARAEGTLADLAGGSATHLTLEADRLRLFPFVISPTAVAAHTGGDASLLARLPFLAVQQPWILGDRVTKVVVDNPEHGHLEGHGHLLLLSQGADGGLFVGDPDRMEPASVTWTSTDRTVTATGARVRVFRGEVLPRKDDRSARNQAPGVEQAIHLQALRTFPGRSTFVLPTVVLDQPKAQNRLQHVRAVCRGDLEVLPAAVLFHGPVVADSLTAAGEPVPAGLHIDAAQLRMDRSASTGELVRIGGKDITMDWSGMKARSADLELDLPWTRFIARDPRGANVEFADGRRLLAERIEVDYVNMAVDAFRVLLDQRPTPKPKAAPAGQGGDR